MVGQEETPPRFVLLEHTWNGVHWDFMLEREGVLKTWALDVLPNLDDAETDARALPDHRAAYLDYEGPISGDRGSVRRLDGGSYQTVVWTEDSVHVRLTGSQLVGEVRLTRRPRISLDGEASPYWTLLRGKVDWRIRREGS